MEKIRAIIIDDEEAARNILSRLIEKTKKNVEIIARAQNLLEGVELIKNLKPDLVFLDVEMPTYAGYEIVNLIDKIDFHIIFVTAYNHYAIKAFEINAIDYLLKPIERIKLSDAINKVVAKIESDQVFDDYQKLIDKLNTDENQTVTFSEAGVKHILKLDEVIAVNALGSYSKIFLKNSKSLMISKNLGTISTELEDFECFFRTHKSWLINKNHIVKYQSGKQSITLTNNLETKLSRFKKENFELICL